jgi:hypothetical protein
MGNLKLIHCFYLKFSIWYFQNTVAGLTETAEGEKEDCCTLYFMGKLSDCLLFLCEGWKPNKMEVLIPVFGVF